MNIEGFETGKPIHSGRLTYWPLKGPDVEGLGFIGQVSLDKDMSYERLRLRSNNGPSVAPWGMMFFFDGGQDRATREAAYVGHEPVVVKSVCLEPSQGGLWAGQKLNVTMLPPSLRASLPAGGGYSALWDSIAKRCQSVGQEKGTTVHGLLEGRVDTPAPLPNAMRGLVIALDGRPIAVEVAPTAEQFAEWWTQFGLGETFSFEADTLPSLPLPLGNTADPGFPEEDGMHQVTIWDVLCGWVYVQTGQIAYVSIVDGEALTQFNEAMPLAGADGRNTPEWPEWEERLD